MGGGQSSVVSHDGGYKYLQEGDLLKIVCQEKMHFHKW